MSKIHNFLVVLFFTITLNACAFFEEPLDDLSLSSPASSSTERAPSPSNNKTKNPSDSNKQSATAPRATRLPAVSESSNPSGKTYFTAVSLFDMPEDAANVSFVHFTSRNTRRELALCEELTEKFSVTKAANIPANAPGLIIWPVRNNSKGTSCSEMLSDYEAIDISNQTAEKVKDNASGPFMLSRNTASGNRLIYDFSSVRPNGLASALTSWHTLLSDSADKWPPYQSAR